MIHGPLIITPQVPLAAIPGDEFIATTSLTNASEGDLETDVRLETEGGLKSSGNSAQHVHLAKNERTSLRWPIHVSEPLGNAVLRFTAKLPEEIIQRTRTLSIRPSSARLTLSKAAKWKGRKGNRTAPTILSSVLDADGCSLDRADRIRRWVDEFLDNYPFDCSEQLTSRAFANLLA